MKFGILKRFSSLFRTTSFLIFCSRKYRSQYHATSAAFMHFFKVGQLSSSHSHTKRLKEWECMQYIKSQARSSTLSYLLISFLSCLLDLEWQKKFINQYNQLNFFNNIHLCIFNRKHSGPYIELVSFISCQFLLHF